MDESTYISLLIDNDIYSALDKNEFSLKLRSLLAIPEAVASFEKASKLPITGKWKKMVKNYNKEFLTSECIQKRTDGVCFPRAVASGNMEYVRYYLNQLPQTFQNFYVYKNAAFAAGKHDRGEVLSLLPLTKINLNAATAGALVGNNSDLFMELYQKGGEITDSNLISIVETGNIELVKYVIESFPKLTWTDALFDAANSKQFDVIKYAVEHGADVNASLNYQSPVVIAISRSSPMIVEYLLSHGAEAGKSELQAVIDYSETIKDDDIYEIMGSLIKHGADINSIVEDGETLLTREFYDNRNFDIIDMLIHFKIDVNKKNKMGDTPLILAVSQGKYDIMDRLLDAGANPDIPDWERMTPIYIAVSSMPIEYVERLIEAGADVNIPNDRGETPLYALLTQDNVEDNVDAIVMEMDLLLEAGANPHIPDKYGDTPITIVAKYMEEDPDVYRPIMDRLYQAL